ncbi:MAG: ABC transporter permease [Sporomusaceae bacterium]|nr:ABC transporter permease [Sporomusaceae bacterium]
MFWRMLQGALFRQSRKMVMVAVTIALGASLTTAMLSVMFDVGDKVNKELKAYGANITVTPRSASLLQDLYGVDASVSSGKYLQESDLGKLKTIFWANNIVSFAPLLETKAQVGSNQGEVTLIGTWFQHNLLLPTGETATAGIQELKSWWAVAGQWPSDGDQQGVLIGAILAKKLGLKVGDSFSVAVNGQEQPLIVRGVLNSGGPEDEQIYASLSLVQQALHVPGRIGKIEVSAITTPENDLARKAAHDPKSLSLKEWETWYCTAYVSSISYQIEEAIAGARAKTVRQVAESEGTILEKTQLLMVLITLLSLAGSTLGISNLLTASMMERSREIGLLKAIGATDSAVLLRTLAEVTVTGLIGGFGGYILGLGFAQIIGRSVFGTAISVDPIVIPWVIGLVLLVTLLGSLPAIRMLLSLRPAAVLHGR